MVADWGAFLEVILYRDAITHLLGGEARVVQTPGAPLLLIKLVGANAVLSWPLNTSGFFLQEPPSLSTPVWTSTPLQVVDTAIEHTVTVPGGGLMKCFRLKHS